MSRGVSLFFSAEIAEGDFRRVVAEFGGTIWEDQVPGLNVTFSDGECHVWIYGADFPPGEDPEPPSPHVVERLVGDVKMRLDLALSHEEDSAYLALRLAASFLSRWPGVAEFPMYTVLAQVGSTHSLTQEVAEDFARPEVQILFVAQSLDINRLIEEFGGLVIAREDGELRASAMNTLSRLSACVSEQDAVVGIIPSNHSYIWILTADFKPLMAPHWNILEPLIQHGVGGVPTSVIRVVPDPVGDDREETTAAALSVAKQFSSLVRGVILGLFYVVLGREQIENALRSGQWMLLR